MIDTIVLSGGGINGIIYIGIIKYIEKYKKYIKYFYGTSIGSVVCLLLLIGYNYDELYDIFLSINFEDYSDLNINNLYYNCHFDNSNKFINLINSMIFYKLKIYNPTFKYLYDKTKKYLYINGSNLTTNKNDIFSYENTPNMNIIDAIKISTCLPFLYKPIIYNNNIYIDGGIFNNYIINEVKNKKYTLGIYISNYQNNKYNNIDNIFNYINIIYNSYCQFTINALIKKYKNITLLIKINNSIINFKLSKEKKIEIINLGYIKTKKYFNNRFLKLQNYRIKQKYFYLLKFYYINNLKRI